MKKKKPNNIKPLTIDEVIDNLRKEFPDTMRNVDQMCKVIDALSDYISLERLCELVQAEKDGRAIIRPKCSTCIHKSAVKYHEPCFDCLGQDQYGTEKGYYYKPCAEAEAALAKEGSKQ